MSIFNIATKNDRKRTDKEILNEVEKTTDAFINGDINENEFDTRLITISKNITESRHADISEGLKTISTQLAQTNISKLDLDVVSLDITDIILSATSDNIGINSKYRILVNRKNRERELSATHKIYLKNQSDPMESKLVTICVKLHAQKCDSSSKYNNLLMEWSILIADTVIRSLGELSSYIPEGSICTRFNDMVSTTEHFDGCIICSTTDKEIPGVVTESSTMPLTTKVISEFSDGVKNTVQSPITITNFNNL